MIEYLRRHAHDLFTPDEIATVERIEPRTPAPDGREFRFEIALRLADSVSEPPDEDTLRAIADEVLAEINDIDDPDWLGADELYIMIYAPDQELDAGACGAVHWLDGEGYESVDVNPLFF